MSYLGENIPKLGFGLMRLPMIEKEVDIEQTKQMVDMFLQKGFTYFDTAYGYIGGKSEEAIKAARTAYNALTDAQKELVENYDVLAAAEAALDELKKDSSLPDTGDDTNIRLFVSLMVMSMMGLTALILIPRKKVV